MYRALAKNTGIENYFYDQEMTEFIPTFSFYDIVIEIINGDIIIDFDNDLLSTSGSPIYRNLAILKGKQSSNQFGFGKWTSALMNSNEVKLDDFILYFDGAWNISIPK